MLFKTRRDRRFQLLVDGPQRLSLSAHHCWTIGIQTDLTTAPATHDSIGELKPSCTSRENPEMD